MIEQTSVVLKLAGAVAVLCAVASAQPAGDAKAGRQPTPSGDVVAYPELDRGTLTSSSYTNKFFGVQIPVPKGWFVHDQATNDQIMEKGKEIVKPDDPKKQTALNAAVKRTFILLTMSKLPARPGEAPRAAFQFIAELLPPALSIKTGNQYLFNVLKVLQFSKVPYEIEENVHQESISRKEFAVMTVKMNFPTGALKQKYHAAVERGYGLTFAATYATEDDLKALGEVLNAIEFRQ